MTSELDARDLTGPRWSAAAVCPRRCVYSATGAPAEDLPDWIGPYFKRGQVLETIVLDELDDEQGAPTQRQVTVPWPAGSPVGTGHADGYEPESRTMVEVVTTADGDLPDRKVTQVAGYAINHPDAEQAVVVSLDPHTWQKRVYPIDLEGVYPKVKEITDQVMAGLQGELPERVCRTPRDGPAMFCPHVAHCFDGWEWPDLDDLLAGSDLLQRLADATDDLALKSAEAKEAAKEVQDLRDELEPLVPANQDNQAHGYSTIKRTEYDQDSFSLAKYVKAGHPVTPEMQPFINTSTVKRWTVKREETTK